MIRTPLNNGLLQSDLDCAGHNLLNVVGVDPNTVTAASIGMVGDGVTDNTTALQSWLNAVGAAKVSSTLLVPEGVYIFSGPLQDGARQNAQILLPVVLHTDPLYSITIRGFHPAPFVPWPIMPGGPAVHIPIPRGTIFKSTLASGSGTRPAFIGGRGPIGGIGPEDNFLSFRLEDMIFQTVQNPQISCLNLSAQSHVALMGDILIVAGEFITEEDAVLPTTSTSYGVIFAAVGFSVLHQVENLNVWGFYNAVLMGESVNASNLGAWCCVNALEYAFSNGPSLIQSMWVWHCKYGLNVVGAHPILILDYQTEHAPPAQTFTQVYDVNDPSNLATADIKWWAVLGNVGPENVFTMNGGSNIQAQRIGVDSHSGPLYVGTDLRVMPITGGGKFQARNPGTNTWADVDQWTNP